ncbi:hypothetical protein M231_05202 [Tremella mesenterica]|uniref:YMC020W-like alpha/beta hydrolase domain-containing protein n=1 Tax=Tremella mesenterica TaxID=5217 RepID=A0A4Q1BIJ4_TREME|nr:hypothetical protein M231_05202 [Tremella mesenterica]
MPSNSKPDRLPSSPSPSLPHLQPSNSSLSSHVSISSRTPRRPHTLRNPSIRKTSTPHISLVFAQAAPTAPLPNRRVASGAEQSLLKQLDGDLGGRTIGLRSRTGSNATLTTVRTGRKSRSPTPSVMEVSELDMEAGPSRGRTRLDDRSLASLFVAPGGEEIAAPLLEVPLENGLNHTTSVTPSKNGDTSMTATTDDGRKEGVERKLNPKHSTSWMRWNSPGPTFPKSKDKGKGKEKEKEDDLSVTQPTINPSLSISGQDANGVGVREDNAEPRTQQELSTSENTRQGDAVPPKNTGETQVVNVDAGSEPPKGWWGWGGGKGREVVSSSIYTPLSSTLPSISKSNGVVDQVKDSLSDPHSGPPAPTEEHVSAAPSLPVPATASPVTVVQSDMPVASDANVKPGGWGTYLGLNRGTIKQSENVIQSSPIPDSHIISVANPPQAVSDSNPAPVFPRTPLETAESTSSVNNRPKEQPQPNESQAGSTEPRTGWGTYLYSFVVPQTKPSSTLANTSARPVEPTDPAADQKPIPAPGTISTSTIAPETSESLDVPPSTQQDANTIPTHPEPPARKPTSPTSSTGWLTYLAFRSTQGKITASSGDAPKSEGVDEVMDFSSDPNFPSAEPSQSAELIKPPVEPTKPIDSLKGKTVQIKQSQNLEIHKKRLSNGSVASSLTPIAPSPQRRSLDMDRTPSSGKTNNSSLPPPPQAPTIQPNMVIPTFKTTFDRPPRCFPPLPPPNESEGAGITATTAGLAWRALGAMGNYVYTPRETPKAVPVSSELDKETRGRKQGRYVGGDLPRRMGLDGGDLDGGWKNVKRVVVVGVHGWFPAKMLNSVIGEPTGTSTKFANMMGQAVKQFFDERGVTDLRLTLIPLEGEGTIDNRVDKLYKAYLSNPAWINDLRRADAIFFAAHSQGCIVTTHLISRMIAQGHIRTPLNNEAVSRCEWAFGPVGLLPPEEPKFRSRTGRGRATVSGAEGGHQKVALLSMCGVHLGPMYSISTSSVIQPYLQWFENAAARELFEFQDTTSAVSQAYQRALSMILENGTRVVLLASLNDQVVPIYGASFSCATHPLLLRALFVDGASYSAEDFMTNLLCFTFMLRNAGIDDQRLIEHLSEATAGSLTGVGHSSPYEELASYTLAVEYLLLAGPAPNLPPLQVEPFSARDARNDFELPWIMRALVDAPEIIDLFPGELKDLKEGVVSWKPHTKALREIKRRLEPMAGRRSKLSTTLHESPSSTSLVSTGKPTELGVSPGGAGIGVGHKSSGKRQSRL